MNRPVPHPSAETETAALRPTRTPRIRFNARAATIGLAIFFAEVVLETVSRLAPGSLGWVRTFFGDVLVVGVLFYAIRSIARVPTGLLACCVLIIAWLVEFSQAIHLVRLLGLGDSYWARILLGTSFDYWDLVAYAMGVAAIYVVESRREASVTRAGSQ